MDAARGNLGQDLFEFAKSYQRFAADDGEVQGFVPINGLQKTPTEFVTLEVADLFQSQSAAKMIVAVGDDILGTIADTRA